MENIMKMVKNILFVSTLLLSSHLVQAAHVWDDPSGWWDNHFSYDQNADTYTGQELSMDFFGSYLNPEGKFTDLFKTNIRHGFWGGGVGLNYFLTRNFGIGTDFNISSKPDDQNLVDYVVGNLYARLPLGNSGFAPYIFGGGGRATSPIYQWTY